MLDTSLFQHYQGLIFDMDGTLLDTMPSHALAWDQVGQFFGYPLQGQLIYTLGGAPASVVAKVLMQQAKMPLELIDEVIKYKRQISRSILLEHSTLLPTFEVVKKFSGYKPLALGTGSHRLITQLLLEKFQITHYFQAIVTAEDVDRHKPQPDTFLRCAELINIKPKSCIVFEDADFGVQAGLNAKMDVYDVRYNKLIKA